MQLPPLGLSIAFSTHANWWPNGVAHDYDPVHNRAYFNGQTYNSATGLFASDHTTFNRASEGSALTASGSYVHFSPGEVRHTNLGALIEPNAQNLAKYSRDFTSSGWSKVGGATATKDTDDGPLGVETAGKLARGALSASYLSQGLAKSATALPYIAYFLVKAGTGNFLAMRLQGNYPSRADTCFDLSLGTVSQAATINTSFTDASSGIIDLSDGWYMCWLKATTDAHATLSMIVSSRETNGSIDSSDTSAIADVYYNHGQLEQSSTLGSPINTDTTVATRAADVTSFDVSATPLSAGTIIDDIDLINFGPHAHARFSELRNVIGADDRIFLSRDGGANSLKLWVYQNGVQIGSEALSGPLDPGRHKLAIAWDGDDVVAYVDGALKATLSLGSAFSSADFGKLLIGSDGGGAGQPNFRLRRNTLWSYRLSASDLEAKTA